jgi:hypothetical protein
VKRRNAVKQVALRPGRSRMSGHHVEDIGLDEHVTGRKGLRPGSNDWARPPGVTDSLLLRLGSRRGKEQQPTQEHED